jgi:iron(III) transport system substrate-binding protein
MAGQSDTTRTSEDDLRPATAGDSGQRRKRLGSGTLVVAALAATVLLLTSACGGGAATTGSGGGGGGKLTAAEKVYAKYATMTGAAREKALVAAAKKEGGSVTLYSTNDDTVNKIGPLFKAKYGITLKGVILTSEQIRQRLLQEHQAGQTKNDLVETLALDQRIYQDQGILAPYKSPGVTSQMDPTALKFKDFVISSYYPYMVTWNTKLVPKGQEPKTYEDLADPKWKGKLVLVEGDEVWYASLYSYEKSKGMSDADFIKMAKAIKANSKTASGHGSTTALLASGDFEVQPQTFQFDVLQGQAKGLKIASQPYVTPVLNQPIGMALTKGASDPAAALLFMDFYLTEGQKVFTDNQRVATNQTVAADAKFIVPKTDSMNAPLDDVLKTDDDVNKWAVAYDNLLKGNGNVLP